MRKILYCFVLLISVANYSQTTSSYTPKINNIPTSPEVALLGRFGDIPIGYYTGTANVSIPIYTIKESGVEIPIELRYHSSGIKVADEATWVGLGWDLSPEGTIIQEIRGKEDQYDYLISQNLNRYNEFKNRFPTLFSGLYTERYQVGYQMNLCCTEYIDMGVVQNEQDDADIIVGLLNGDGQPDIYNYNFGGLSGKFYINPENNQVVLIDSKENIIFEKIGNFHWKAKTLDGAVYDFGTIETAHGDLTTNYSGRAFKLDNIVFTNGKRIDFTYSDEEYYETHKRQSTILFGLENVDPVGTPISNLTLNKKKTLNKIVTSEYEIIFNTENREDLIPTLINTPKRLTSIDIKTNSGQKILSFLLTQSYFDYNTIGCQGYNNSLESYLGKRLKLDQIKEVAYDNGGVIDTKPSYKLEYDTSKTMPLKISNAVDFWGYYNGENNFLLLPDLRYFDYPYDPRYQNSQVFTYNYEGANRYTNNDFAGTYMLKKITYPTGGSSKFDYEPNSFTNQFIPDKTKLDIARKRTILRHLGSHPQTVYHKSFTLNESTTITFKNSVFNGNIFSNNSTTSNNAPMYSLANFYGSKIVFSKTRILPSGLSQTTIIKQWDTNSVLTADYDLNNGFNWNEEIRVNFDNDKTVYYSVDITNTLNYLPNDTYHVAEIKSDFYYYDDTGVNISESNQCGMRVKSIKNYSEIGTLISNKKINYFGGKLLNKFEPLTAEKSQFSNHCTFYSDDFNGIWTINSSVYNRISISSDDFGIDGGNPIGYTRVEEVELPIDDSNSNIGKKTFTYENEINLTQKGLPNIPNLRNGLLAKEEVFDRFSTKLKETNYIYNDQFTSNIFNGFKINLISHGPTDLCEMKNITSNGVHMTVTENNYIIPNDGLKHRYSFSAYPIISRRILLINKETKNYFNNHFVAETEAYAYNSFGLIKTVSSINSKNESLITKYYYPNDNLITPYIDNLMTYLNILNKPVITETYNGTNKLSTQRTFFDQTVGGIQPKYIEFSKGNDALERKLTYNLYDNKGKVLQYTLENGTPVAILWEGEYPKAKVENATYADASVSSLSSLTNVMVTTYTFKPLVGVTSITDPKGNTIHYNYDAYGRLINVKDKENNILSENEYHYLPQN